MEKMGNFVQLGIVSYGYGCATSFPGVYTRLEKYTDWIQDAVKQDVTQGNNSKPGPIGGGSNLILESKLLLVILYFMHAMIQ